MSEIKNPIKVDKLLRSALRPKGSAPLTGGELEDSLLPKGGIDFPPSYIERAEARFAQRVFESEHEEPIRSAGDSTTFGEFIRRIRSEATVARRAAAAAVEKDLSFINQLESGAVLPWKLPSIDVARVVKLYRIHSEAVWNLVTELTAGTRPSIISYNGGASQPGSDTGSGMPPEEVRKWLIGFNESLRQLGAHDLLE